MIKSMTGFGAASIDTDAWSLEVEIKTLNSKYLDCSIRSNVPLGEKDLELRALVTDALTRGKVTFSLDFREKTVQGPSVELNQELFATYYNIFKQAANQVQAQDYELFKLALQQPEVLVSQNKEHLIFKVWPEVLACIKQALEKVNTFRGEEGQGLLAKFEENISIIRTHLDKVMARDPQRITNLKTRIKANLTELVQEDQIDGNRLEQELIYYIEKLDINEEKVRLTSHLDYFLKTLRSQQSNGKKLGFISQEIGREINTIGSKANDAEIQQYVTTMKEELEKIKEQMLNIV